MTRLGVATDSVQQGFQAAIQNTELPQPPPPPQSPLYKIMTSPLGISGVALLVFCVALLILRPSFVLKTDNGTGKKSVDVVRVLAISLVCAACVFLIPTIVCRTTCK